MPEKAELERSRRPYCKPEIERVDLQLEEAVLVTCKHGGGSGPGVHNCSPGAPCVKQNPS